MKEERKALLDENTPYLTLLPPMDEGFHIGYKAVAGIQSDGNQKPGEWLENFAKTIRTPGEDVAYSIPDVLANEQQLRRLARLPHELAMRHQEMISYRAILAVLLLWDHLATGSEDATLALETLPDGRTDFGRSIAAALPKERMEQGLRVFTLCRQSAETPDKLPLCMLSDSMALVPAANPGDLRGLLPPAVTWYDGAKRRFLDPCPLLNEEARCLLIWRLRAMLSFYEERGAGEKSRLNALLSRFAEDLVAWREGWRARLAAGEPQAMEELRVRVMAVYGLSKRETRLLLTKKTLTEVALGSVPLLRQLFNGEFPEAPEGETAELYLLDGVAFARRSDGYLLEPTLAAGEETVLEAARREIALLDRHDQSWRQDMAAALDGLLAECAGRTGAQPCVTALLERWKREYLAYPRTGERTLFLRYPVETESAALSPLLWQMLGREAEGFVRKPFSDCLTLVSGGGEELEQVEGEALCFLPPLSPEAAAWLEAMGERDEPGAPKLRGLSCKRTERGLEARFTVECRFLEDGGLTPGTVTFERVYLPRPQPEEGAAVTLERSALPRVTVWPQARLAPELWRAYYVHVHSPETLDVWALHSQGWKMGETRSAKDELYRRRPQARAWQTARVDRFPAYVALKRGALSMGALANDLPFHRLRRDDAAVIGVDFGSIATTVMLKQGDKVQPASLPEGLHGTLLGGPEDERFLREEFLPRGAVTAGQAGESTFYSVMDLFSDAPEKWNEPLLDGHIYYPASLQSLLLKGEGTLYYDLKWSEEEYVLRCLRLFLKQTMVQASLSARLWGAGRVSWRVSVPSALPLYKQEAYLDMMQGLSREVAKECGLPLSGDCPAVLYAMENQADGLYFRGRNEVNAKGGYLNLDVGGGTADMSLWLCNAAHATAECSLLLGCRQMLYASVERGRAEDFRQDFAGAEQPALAEAAQGLSKSLLKQNTATRWRQRNMLLMDDFFAAYAGEIRETMAAARARGRITYVESLLLFNFGFLFHLCGALLKRAYEDEELRPLLPTRMELCVAGNGGQLLKALTQEQVNALCRLALAALPKEHPTRAILTVQSADPKREVALGLLQDDGWLKSTPQGADRWNGTFEGEQSEGESELEAYLLGFARAFPQAANRLCAKQLETDPLRGDVRLSAVSRLELQTIWGNEREKTPLDDFSTYVRCFTGMKRLWGI